MPETNQTDGRQRQANSVEKPAVPIAQEMSRHSVNARARVAKPLNLAQSQTVTTAFTQAWESERTATKDLPIDGTRPINAAALEKDHYTYEQHLTELNTGLKHLSEQQEGRQITADKAYERAKQLFDKKEQAIKTSIEANNTKIKAARLAKEIEETLLKANADRLAALQKFKDDILKQEAKFIDIEQKNAAALYVQSMNSDNANIINPKSPLADQRLGITLNGEESTLNPAVRYFKTRHGTLGFVQGNTVTIDFSKNKSIGNVLLSQVLGSFGLNYIGNVRDDIRDQLMVLKAQGCDEVTISAENKEIAKLTWFEANLMGFKSDKIKGYQPTDTDQEHLGHFLELRDRPVQFTTTELERLAKKSTALSEGTFLLEQFGAEIATTAKTKEQILDELNTAINERDEAVQQAEEAVRAAERELGEAKNAKDAAGQELESESSRISESIGSLMVQIERLGETMADSKINLAKLEAEKVDLRNALSMALEFAAMSENQRQEKLAPEIKKIRKELDDLNKNIEDLEKLKTQETEKIDGEFNELSNQKKAELEKGLLYSATKLQNETQKINADAKLQDHQKADQIKMAQAKYDSDIAQAKKTAAEEAAKLEKNYQQRIGRMNESYNPAIKLSKSKVIALNKRLEELELQQQNPQQAVENVKTRMLELDLRIEDEKKQVKKYGKTLNEERDQHQALAQKQQAARSAYDEAIHKVEEATAKLTSAEEQFDKVEKGRKKANLLRETALLERDFARFKAAKVQREEVVRQRDAWQTTYTDARDQNLLPTNESDRKVDVKMNPVPGGRWFWGTISPLRGSKKALNELSPQQAQDRELLTAANQVSLKEKSETALADIDNKLYAEAQQLKRRAKALDARKGDIGSGLTDPTNPSVMIETRIGNLKTEIVASCNETETAMRDSPYFAGGRPAPGFGHGGGLG